MGSRDFCDDPLWDLNRTWYTENPDFTTCFHQTVLTYVPAGILLLLSPLSFWSSKKSRDGKVPWTVLNGSRTAVNVCLVVLPFIDIGYAVDEKYVNVSKYLKVGTI